jgi:peptidylprolyl isomerase/peptidyl-prolyl cis-trans isomerase A (cyclophilin A)/peptidyl-prolyl cis-trans isomerase B (cyclophilin B)
MRKLLLLSFFLALPLYAADVAPAPGTPATAPAAVTHPLVELKTNRGIVVLELLPEKAPRSVANFLQYVKDGHYNGTIFHRVIDGFMIQGGGFDPQFHQKITRPPIQNEADNGLKNTVGTVAMARTSNPHSATAQFFINIANNGFLDFRARTDQGYGYAVFGRVRSGMDVVGAIAKSRTGKMGPYQDVPTDPIVIESATLLPNSQ